MAIYKKPKTVKQWLEDNQPVTWFEHGIITALIGFAGAMLASRWTWDVLLWGAVAATLAALGYLYKEVFIDKPGHERDGTWRRPDWEGITALVDEYGDAIPPWIAAAAWWLAYAADLVGRMQ